MELGIVVTTVGTEEDARRLAAAAVAERRAACVQIVKIDSVYLWKGVQRDAEWRLELKTLMAGTGAVMEWLAGIHPYDEPELLVLPVRAASKGYAGWVEGEVAPT